MDKITQANNTRSNVRIEYKGEKYTIAEWSRITGIDQDRLWDRYRVLKWDIESMLTIPTGDDRAYKVKERPKRPKSKIRELCEEHNISIDRVWARVNRQGWDFERALTEKIHKGDDALGKRITINNETHNITTWLKINNIPEFVYKKRKKNGWDIKDALTIPYVKKEPRQKTPKEPKRKKIRCVETGEIYKNCAEAARATGVSYSGLRNTLCGFSKTCGGYRWERVE